MCLLRRRSILEPIPAKLQYFMMESNAHFYGKEG